MVRAPEKQGQPRGAKAVSEQAAGAKPQGRGGGCGVDVWAAAAGTKGGAGRAQGRPKQADWYAAGF